MPLLVGLGVCATVVVVAGCSNAEPTVAEDCLADPTACDADRGYHSDEVAPARARVDGVTFPGPLAADEAADLCNDGIHHSIDREMLALLLRYRPDLAEGSDCAWATGYFATERDRVKTNGSRAADMGERECSAPCFDRFPAILDWGAHRAIIESHGGLNLANLAFQITVILNFLREEGRLAEQGFTHVRSEPVVREDQSDFELVIEYASDEDDSRVAIIELTGGIFISGRRTLYTVRSEVRAADDGG